MHDWLLETWYGGTRRGRWLLPGAWLFGAAAALRRTAYRRGWLASYRSPRAVVVVGNLTVGGTGKTPLVLWLAARLQAAGYAVGIACRGYRGRRTGARLVAASDDPRQVGDEPALLARRGIAAVAVGADRAAAVRLLEPRCEVVLCDDGLQHYALARDAEIVVVDGARGFGNGLLLPAGPLREPPWRLRRADVVVVNGPGSDLPGALRMGMEAVQFVNVANGERRPPWSFRGERIKALAGVGHPERFFRLLEKLGAQVERHPLPDHAQPAAALAALGDDIPVLMTEKDAVKCAVAAGSRHWYLEIAADFSPEDAARLMSGIDAALPRRN